MRKALRRLPACRGFGSEEYQPGEDLLTAPGSHPLDYLSLDLRTPEVNGSDVLEAVRSRQIPRPVIVFTAHDEPGTAERVQGLGAVAYRKKPVDRCALSAAIAAAIPARMPITDH